MNKKPGSLRQNALGSVCSESEKLWSRAGQECFSSLQTNLVMCKSLPRITGVFCIMETTRLKESWREAEVWPYEGGRVRDPEEKLLAKTQPQFQWRHQNIGDTRMVGQLPRTVQVWSRASSSLRGSVFASQGTAGNTELPQSFGGQTNHEFQIPDTEISTLLELHFALI